MALTKKLIGENPAQTRVTHVITRLAKNEFGQKALHRNFNAGSRLASERHSGP